MESADQYYRQRDDRTERATALDDASERPVRVVVGPDVAGSVAGQILLLSLVNLLSRFHRSLDIDCPNASLVAPALVEALTIDTATMELARAIDPFVRMGEQSTAPITIAVGCDAPGGADIMVGCAGFAAEMTVGSRAACPTVQDGIIGAGVAACLAASAAFRLALGLDVTPQRMSLWGFQSGAEYEPGPIELPALDVGDVLIVGVGGVGSCLAYWLSLLQFRGHWTVVDGDEVSVSNLNRCLPFLARHTGMFAREPSRKAEVVAKLIGAAPIDAWYDALDQDSHKPDLVLSLADGRFVRQQISMRGQPVVLQATTQAAAWEAQSHRHIYGIDDCPACRIPETEHVKIPACSKGAIEVVGDRLDAALPFLSAAAGLMLVASIFQLQQNRLGSSPRNLWRWSFGSRQGVRGASVQSCGAGCHNTLAPTVVRQINEGRWSSMAHVDP